MNCHLFINEAGEVVISHDAPLPFEPRLVKHEKRSNRLIAVGKEDGASIEIGQGVAPELADDLAKAREVLLVRIEGEEPIEGFELALIHV